MTYGKWITFNTGDANVFFEPEVHTMEATVITSDGAQLSGVFVEGTEDILERGFKYWIVSGSKTRAIGGDAMTVAISGNNTSVTLRGLKVGTEYGYCSYVKTASGTAYGEEKTFKTTIVGDVNGDKKVNAVDITYLVKIIMKQ